MRLDKLKREIIGQITKPTKRDKQSLIGPSQIGGCPYCVGETLAASLPKIYKVLPAQDRFGLGSWIGTGVHSYLDETLEIEGAIKEQKNEIYTMKGYGTIKGSTDLFVEPHVFDYKVVGKWSFDKMRMEYLENPDRIPTTQYRVQQMLYGYGWKLKGHEVETVNLCVIPKLSNNVDDIKFFTEAYNEELALAALDRLEKIYKLVKEGRLNDLPSDEDCYVCSRITFRI